MIFSFSIFDKKQMIQETWVTNIFFQNWPAEINNTRTFLRTSSKMTAVTYQNKCYAITEDKTEWEERPAMIYLRKGKQNELLFQKLFFLFQNFFFLFQKSLNFKILKWNKPDPGMSVVTGPKIESQLYIHLIFWAFQTSKCRWSVLLLGQWRGIPQKLLVTCWR